MIVGKLGEARARPARGRRRAGGDREALRHDARRGAPAQPRRASVFEREAGLPDRPLPGQGDRPERDGLPVRQRDVRAAVEPQLHRLRADHGGRGHRHRHPRGLLRRAGALRDLVQNHMLQLLCAAGMEPPTAFDADEVRDEKVKVLRAIRPPSPTSRRMAVRAQYTAGRRRRRAGHGYLEEDGVPPDSKTETFAALRLEVENWRWAGVPFYLRTGKRLARKVTEIAVTLKPVPHLAFAAGRLARRAAQPARAHGAAQRGRVAVDRGEDPGHAHAHPPGEHGVPLRHRVPVAVARGLRAPDHRRDARRRDAVHARRRGRRAVGDHRPDPQGLGAVRRRRWRSTPPARRGPRRPTGCSRRAERWRTI